jgi:hypothetical protein
MQSRLVKWLFPFLALLLAAPAAFAQAAPARVYTQAQLDQMLAPIALYPDPLLSQILMAATYPLEVVQAARWSDVHPGLQGDEAVRAVEYKDWDPSVKSLVAFPRVLAMMDQRLDWTQELGEAFLEQEPYVMDTVQRLRERALAAGNLTSNEGILVSQQGGTIIIEPANPLVVYVPYYDPLLVYGGWWWPAYPPVRWAPWPGYAVRPGISVSIYLGGGVRVSTGFFFGAFDWRQRQVNIVRQTYYYRPVTVLERRHVETLRRGAPARWQHEAMHRRGIDYRSRDLGKRYPQRARPAPVQRETRERARPATAPRAMPDRTRPAPVQRETRQRAQPAPALRTQPAPAQRAQPAPAQRETRQRAPEARKEQRREQTREAAPRDDDRRPQPQGRGRRDN